jgi:hypothetical protein
MPSTSSSSESLSSPYFINSMCGNNTLSLSLFSASPSPIWKVPLTSLSGFVSCIISLFSSASPKLIQFFLKTNFFYWETKFLRMVNCDFIFIAFTEAAYLSKEIVYFELAIFKFCGFGCHDLNLRVAQAGQVIVN